MNKKEIYKKLIEKNKEKQLIVAIEELSELQKEICKSLRGKLNKTNLVEEIADVEIMLEQIKLYFDIQQTNINLVKQQKIVRTYKRLLGIDNE